MGAGIAAAATWIGANAGTIAAVAGAGAAVYSATTSDTGGGNVTVDSDSTYDKTSAEQAASLDEVETAKKKNTKSGSKSRFKVQRPTATTSTGVNVESNSTAGVQI